MSNAVSQRDVDVVVVGGGPGGYAAAFQAADRGLKTVLVDKRDTPGGVCLHVGCIPSKTLLHAAEVISEAAHAKSYGVEFSAPKIDLDKLRGWKDDVVKKLTGGLAQIAKLRGVDFVQGTVTFESSELLRIEGEKTEKIRFRNAIVATGSRPAGIPGLQVDDPRVMNSSGGLALEDVPKRLLVVGGGYIGLEMGSVYAALGSKVTVVELLDGLLPGADRDLVRPLEKRLRDSFEAIWLETKVVAMKPQKKGIEVHFEGKAPQKTETFDRVLVSVGRKPNSEGLGLENTKVKIDPKGFVEIDEQCRTADPKIFAIGDVAGEPMLAHKASREGKIAADVIAGHAAAFDNVAIPAVVFTDPEIAWSGLTENAAQAQGRKVEVVRFPWAASGRALSLGRTEGFTKIIFEPETERVLGVGIVGPGAGELIAEGTLAIEMAAVAEDLAATIHAHPTLSETIMEAAESLFGHATHIYRKKK